MLAFMKDTSPYNEKIIMKHDWCSHCVDNLIGQADLSINKCSKFNFIEINKIK